MKTVIFETPEDQARGLQFLPTIDRDTLYVFPLIEGGTFFHSRNVAEPFDLAFVAEDWTVIALQTITPPLEVMEAPAGTFMALESKGGRMRAWNIVPGGLAYF